MGAKVSKMRPGFRVLVDMTELGSMDYTGARHNSVAGYAIDGINREATLKWP